MKTPQNKKLIQAILNDDTAKVKSMVERGLDPRKRIKWSSIENFTPLESAVANNSVSVITYLLKAGVPADDPHDHSSPLMRACAIGNVKVIELLLAAGADVNREQRSPSSDRGTTALMIAASRGYLPIVRMLLDTGADPKKHTRLGANAISQAVPKGNLPVVKELVRSGCPVTGKAVILSADTGNLDLLKLLLKEGGDPNFVDDGVPHKHLKGETALSIAARNKNIDLAKCLIENRADPNLPANKLYPLSGAAFQGDFRMVKLLLDAGAKTEVVNLAGYTPLGSACEMGHTEIVKLLLSHNADSRGKGRNQLGRDGETPIELAQRKGHTMLLHLLQK